MVKGWQDWGRNLTIPEMDVAIIIEHETDLGEGKIAVV